MPSHRPILWFFFKVAAIYGLLLIPWPGLLWGYRTGLVAAGNLFFHRMGDARVTFAPIDAPTLDKDTDVRLQNIYNPQRSGTLNINARRHYLPTSFTLALIAAAPISWRRKIWALPLGFALFSAYAGGGLWLKLAYGLSAPEGLAALSYAPITRSAMLVLIKVLTMSPVSPYIAALLVCVLVSVRREDIVRLGGLASGARRAPHTASPA